MHNGTTVLPLPGRPPRFATCGARAERRPFCGGGLPRPEPLSLSTDAFGGVHGRIGCFRGRPGSYIRWYHIASHCMALCHIVLRSGLCDVVLPLPGRPPTFAICGARGGMLVSAGTSTSNSWKFLENHFFFFSYVPLLITQLE